MNCHSFMIRVHNKHQNWHIVQKQSLSLDQDGKGDVLSGNGTWDLALHFFLLSDSSGHVFPAVSAPWCSGWVVECVHRYLCSNHPNTRSSRLRLQHCATSARQFLNFVVFQRFSVKVCFFFLMSRCLDTKNKLGGKNYVDFLPNLFFGSRHQLIRNLKQTFTENRWKNKVDQKVDVIFPQKVDHSTSRDEWIRTSFIIA